MKSKIIIVGFTFLLLSSSIFSQNVLGKLRQKATQAVDQALEKKVDPNASPSSGQNSGSNTNDPTNKGGGGLITTPPDVKQNLSDAEVAYKTNSYGDARYAVQQAMLGVELEIGNNILKSLPETVGGLKKEDQSDQVTSTGWGWAGLTIQREYRNEDKQLKTTIANNAVWMSAVNMYLTNGGYAQQTGGQQNWKQIKVKGYRGIIEYDESSGYKVSVPIGQSSLIVWEGVNFASEQAITTAVNVFDLDGIKKMLGEQ